MKKIGLFTLTVLLSSVVFAQTDAKFGIKGGLNISSTSNDRTGQSGSKAGFHLGLLSHIHLDPQWSLQPEIMYSNQGAKVAGIDLNLNYILIPVLVQYNFDNGFRLQTGPQLGILAGVNDNEDVFSSSNFKQTDIAWSFGASYLTYSGFGIDGRYNLGLSKINNDPTRSGKTHSSVFQIGLFYLFDHSHKAHSR